MIISAVFDSTITSDPNGAAIEGTINTAIATYESLFTNNITVSIYFQEMTSGLGESNTDIYDESYTSFYNDLVANNGNPAAITGLNANGGDANTNGGVNPVTGDSNIQLNSADARALGINIPPACFGTGAPGSVQCGSSGTGPYDGIISLNTGITYPPQPNNGSNYALISVAEHEIDEVLGLGSALINTNNPSGSYNTTPFGDPTPEDLFRYNAATGGSRTLSTNCATPTSAYFSYGSASTALAEFNNACNGDDFGDWLTGAAPPQVQDANGTPGVTTTLGPNEIAALTAVGYTMSQGTPEPGTWVLFGTSLGLVGLAKRRRIKA
jgi:hypothetical protein